MPTIPIRWASWFGDTDLGLTFPPEWEVSLHAMRGGPALSPAQIEAGLDQSIDWPGIQQRAGAIRKVAIAVDDLTRPTPAWQILSPLLTRLQRAGIGPERICILMALGTHAIIPRDGLIRKLGRPVVSQIEVRNHSPFSGLIDLGRSSAGFVMKVNRTFAEADLRFGISCILPHSDAGFSGGAKIVMPGLCGIETIEQVHGMAPVGIGFQRDRAGMVEGNALREQMEAIARTAGLQVSINLVLDAHRQVIGLFAGDVVEAHRQAVQLARQVLATPMPRQVDVAILNAYPKDTEFLQVVNALHIISANREMFIQPEGTIVLTTAASEGRGFHYLMCPEGIRPFVFDRASMLAGRRLLIYSPGVSLPDVRTVFPPDVEFYTEWPAVERRLHELHGRRSRVAVFPCASMQIPAEGRDDT